MRAELTRFGHLPRRHQRVDDQATNACQLDGCTPDAAAGTEHEKRCPGHQGEHIECLQSGHGTDRDGRRMSSIKRFWGWAACRGLDVQSFRPGADDAGVGDDAISERKALHIGTDGCHPARQLRTQHEGWLPANELRQASAGHAHIPRADADGLDRDTELPCVGRTRRGDVVDRVAALHRHGLGSHASSVSLCRAHPPAGRFRVSLTQSCRIRLEVEQPGRPGARLTIPFSGPRGDISIDSSSSADLTRTAAASP